MTLASLFPSSLNLSVSCLPSTAPDGTPPDLSRCSTMAQGQAVSDTLKEMSQTLLQAP